MATFDFFPAQNFRVRIFLISILFLLVGYALEIDYNWLPFKVTNTFFWMTLIDSSLKLVSNLIFTGFIPKEQHDKAPKIILILPIVLVVLIGAFVMASIWGANLTSLLASLCIYASVLGLTLLNILSELDEGLI